jgi:hypothetical protein
MQAHHWGLKTFYYSLINKAGSKSNNTQPNNVQAVEHVSYDEEENCESCKL